MKKYQAIKLLLALLLLSTSSIFAWKCFTVKNTYHEHIPVVFTASDCPCIEINIGEKYYPVVIDLGSKFHMELDKEVICEIPQKAYKMVSWVNIKNTRYRSSQLIVPKASIRSIEFHNVKTIEIPDEDDTILWRDPSIEKHQEFVRPVGFLGKPFFEKHNLLLDLPHSCIVLSNDKNQLEKKGYSLSSYIKVPIELTKKHIIVKVNTEVGIARLVIDSAATWTIMKKSTLKGKSLTGQRYGLPFFTSNSFEINGYNFGKKDIYLYDFPEEAVNIDGVLGLDFFKEHVVYLDFNNKTAFIKP